MREERQGYVPPERAPRGGACTPLPWLSVSAVRPGVQEPQQLESPHEKVPLRNEVPPVTVFLSSQSREALTTCVAGNDRSILLKYVERELLVEGSLFKCTLCGKSGAQKNNVVNHVENIHFPGTFQYICPVCNKPMITKKALDNHIHRNHKENSSQYSAH